MQSDDELLIELEASDTEEKAPTTTDTQASVSPTKGKSKFSIDHRQNGMLGMGAVVILGLAFIFGPGLFTSKPQRQKALETVSQQEPEELQAVIPVPQPVPVESNVEKNLDAVHNQINEIKAGNDKEIALLEQLLAQSQHNSEQIIETLQRGVPANPQAVADAAKVDSNAKATLKKVSIRHIQHLPAFAINTIYPNEAWLRLGPLTYVVSPGDVLKGIRIIAIDPESHTVTTSAGVIH